MLSRNPPRRRPHQLVGDAGVTLMELMVTMAMTTIMGAMAIGMFLSSNTSTRYTVNANISGASARVTLDSWATLLQSTAVPSQFTPDFVVNSQDHYNNHLQGQAIYKITPTSIVFFSNIGNRGLTMPSSTLTPSASTSTLIQLQWVGSGQSELEVTSNTPASQCPASSIGGCLFETRYKPYVDHIDVLANRLLLTNVAPGAGTADGACAIGAVTPTPSGSDYPTQRLFTACGGVDTTLGQKCVVIAGNPCNSTVPDTDVLATFPAGNAGLIPTSIVVAFTVTNTDSTGASHAQSYVSAAALTNVTQIS